MASHKTAIDFVKNILENLPESWLKLTTHRLDIYNESMAKVEFLEHLERLFLSENLDIQQLNELPTAYDYIRLGHPLSCVLEWVISKLNHAKPEQIVSFQSYSMPIMAVLRKNHLNNKKTRILYATELPKHFDQEVIRKAYGYSFELEKLTESNKTAPFEGSSILVTNKDEFWNFDQSGDFDFQVHIDNVLGSVILISDKNDEYASEIQHVRRRESVAMTPVNCHSALKLITGFDVTLNHNGGSYSSNKSQVHSSLKSITATSCNALLASSGLSMQYAIMMGLVEDALEKHPGNEIKFLVPPNCYGGTNDQARRVAACIKNVEIVDLPVDREHDMAHSIDRLLDQIAENDAIPYIIAEIPTNPRVEVPDLDHLHKALSKKRKTANGEVAIDPVFILDQTFCPNVQFLAKGGIFESIRAICYVSGSKFPSGGKCTAGYCVANSEAEGLLPYIDKHLVLCDNEATPLQVQNLAEQLPLMNHRISEAYKNTREFVNYIQDLLPSAKINFVSEDLVKDGFTPSVFSLDLPTKGNTDQEREDYKRAMNAKLIEMMITQIPDESKHCVSYGQLKGCYWTIPATSTQGTTKEADKDYIARVSLSGNMNLEKHKQVFAEFVEQM